MYTKTEGFITGGEVVSAGGYKTGHIQTDLIWEFMGRRVGLHSPDNGGFDITKRFIDRGVIGLPLCDYISTRRKLSPLLSPIWQ